MLGKISLMAAILATLALPATEALASRVDVHHEGYRASAYHRSYRTGHHRGYGVHYYRPVYVAVPAAARLRFGLIWGALFTAIRTALHAIATTIEIGTMNEFARLSSAGVGFFKGFEHRDRYQGLFHWRITLHETLQNFM